MILSYYIYIYIIIQEVPPVHSSWFNEALAEKYYTELDIEDMEIDVRLTTPWLSSLPREAGHGAARHGGTGCGVSWIKIKWICV